MTPRLKVEEELVQLTGCFAQQGAVILKFTGYVFELIKRIVLQILCNSLFRMATLFQRNSLTLAFNLVGVIA